MFDAKIPTVHSLKSGTYILIYSILNVENIDILVSICELIKESDI